MQQKKRKFEEDVSSHTTQLAQIDQEVGKRGRKRKEKEQGRGSILIEQNR